MNRHSFRGWRSLPLAATALGAFWASAHAFDLSLLPAYQPQVRVSGTIRTFGSPLGDMIPAWEEGFRRFHPDAVFADTFSTGDAAMCGLVGGGSDLSPTGREPDVPEYRAFVEMFGYAPTTVAVMTGGFGAPGASDGIGIYVRKDNPIERLTVRQLDGIFGSERSGGVRGYRWSAEERRASDADVRTWGQLGLGGGWADKAIRTYGLAPGGAAEFFRSRILRGGDKWNPNFREFVAAGSKIGGEGLDAEDMTAEVSADRYAIAWMLVPAGRAAAALKPVAIAATDAGPYVLPGPETFQNGTYPLARSAYICLNRPPGKPLEPKVREFLLYCLSREGQEAVMRQGKFLPLTPEMAQTQRLKLE